MSEPDLRHLDRDEGETLAYRRVPGRAPTAVFFGGFRSDMTGSKATSLEALARRLGTGCVRFDYYAHGASSGRLEHGTIGRWRADGLAVVDELTNGPLVFVGSSMGAWIALLVALARPERVRAFVGIASAPDFTEELIWGRMTADERAALQRDRVAWRRSDYDGAPWPLTYRLVEEARVHCVLGGAIPLGCPVRLLHGMSDADVPWELSRRLADAVESDDVELTLVKGGDHRLSATPDLERLARVVTPLLAPVD